jgi:hypothetical protein
MPPAAVVNVNRVGGPVEGNISPRPADPASSRPCARLAGNGKDAKSRGQFARTKAAYLALSAGNVWMIYL